MRTILLCGMLCALVGVGLAFAGEPCYRPSGHQKPCSNRPNMVSSCGTGFQWTETVCKSKRMYTTPVPVPDGKVESDSGSTYTDKIKCVKEYGCQWHVSQAFCYDEVDWDTVPFSMEDKIVDNPKVTCPVE